MEKWKTIGKRVLFPPVWLLMLLVVVCTAALITVFLKGWEETILAYCSYVLSFYTLTAVCLVGWKVIPGWYRAVKDRAYSNRYSGRYLRDAAFRTHVSLYLSLGVNLLYVGVNVLSGLLYHSAWYGIMAGYYGILAVMRFLLLRYVGRQKIGTDLRAELRRSRLCAMILLTLNLVLSGAVLMILYQNRGYASHGMLIYVMALYTFYGTTNAIINLVKYRKYNSPIMSTAKVISLMAALVSMLTLETAMFAQFGGDMSPRDQQIMIAATGGGIALVVVGMAVYLIYKANCRLRLLKENEPKEEGAT